MRDFNKLAQRLVRDHGPEEAIGVLVAEARSQHELRDHLVQLGAQQIVRNAMHAGRAPSIELVTPAEAGREARRKFMDTYRLAGSHILLGDATRKDLADAAREHDKQITGHDSSRKFLREVASRLPEGKRVREVFQDAKLKELAKR